MDKQESKETYYSGYLLLQGGYQQHFKRILEGDMDMDLLEAVNNMNWRFNDSEVISLDSGICIPVCKIIGFSISSYEE